MSDALDVGQRTQFTGDPREPVEFLGPHVEDLAHPGDGGLHPELALGLPGTLKENEVLEEVRGEVREVVGRAHAAGLDGVARRTLPDRRGVTRQGHGVGVFLPLFSNLRHRVFEVLLEAIMQSFKGLARPGYRSEDLHKAFVDLLPVFLFGEVDRIGVRHLLLSRVVTVLLPKEKSLLDLPLGPNAERELLAALFSRDRVDNLACVLGIALYRDGHYLLLSGISCRERARSARRRPRGIAVVRYTLPDHGIPPWSGLRGV